MKIVKVRRVGTVSVDLGREKAAIETRFWGLGRALSATATVARIAAKAVLMASTALV